MEIEYAEKIATALATAEEWHELARALVAKLDALHDVAAATEETVDYDIVSFCRSAVILMPTREVKDHLRSLLNQRLEADEISS